MRQISPTIERVPAQDACDAVTLAEAMRAQFTVEKIQQYKQLALDLPLPVELKTAIFEAIAFLESDPPSWEFLLMNAVRLYEVVDWLHQNSMYSGKSQVFFISLLTYLKKDTCEVMVSRRQLAQKHGISTHEVTKLMAELRSIGVISTQKQGRFVRYFFNPLVGSKMSKVKREAAIAVAPELKLVIGE